MIRDSKGITNAHLLELDKDNPVLLNHNGYVDTIVYYRKYDAGSQYDFDKNLRLALGLPVDGLDYIVMDSYDRENNTINYYDKHGNMQIIGTPANFLKLDMFSEKVLLNEGSSCISYAGYNYVGDKQKGNADPYSFYTDFTIDASRPEYWAVFVQDEFKFGLHIVRPLEHLCQLQFVYPKPTVPF